MSKPIINLKLDDGSNIDFYDWGHVNYGGSEYALLQPVDYKKLNWKDGDVLVCEIVRKSDATHYVIESNDKISDKVIKIYNSKNSGSSFTRGSKKLLGMAKKATSFLIRLIFAIVGIAVTIGGVGMIIGGATSGNTDITLIIVGAVLTLIGLTLAIKNIKKIKNG